ncbi:YrvL family regulatory protein [Agathobacter sp.]|uniref:YrvL family regulatory protein n=1 Tax=Agathobacter sp. TaxID=2021311 RepID=UPI003FD7DD28
MELKLIRSISFLLLFKVFIYLLLDTFATFMGLRIVDYFMQSISATTISIIIVSFVFALFGVSDFNNKRKG